MLKDVRRLIWRFDAESNFVNYTSKGLDDEAVSRLIELGKFETVSVLDLSSNKIGDVGTIALVNFFIGTKLNLAQNSIGYNGAIALAKMLKDNKTLTRLNLFGNENLSENGIIAIANALEYNNTLKTLVLSNLTDRAVIALANTIKINKTIKKIIIVGSNHNGNEVRRIFARSIALERRNIDTGGFISQQMITDEATKIKLKNFIAARNQLESMCMPEDVREKIMEEFMKSRNDDAWLFEQRVRNTCLGCFIGEAQFVEQHDPTRQFCSSYCQRLSFELCPDRHPEPFLL
jgi:hypothetical protein